MYHNIIRSRIDLTGEVESDNHYHIWPSDTVGKVILYGREDLIPVDHLVIVGIISITQ